MTEKATPLIRPATADDNVLLAELGARTFYDTFAADCKPEDMAAYLSSAFSPEIQAAELADPSTTFLIAEIDGVASGYVQSQKGDAPLCIAGPNPIELARLYVSKEWFGRGVGEALMRACVEAARRAGHQTMWLGVWERNFRAQAFYRKWNFHVVGDHIFQVGSDPQTDLLMECELQ